MDNQDPPRAKPGSLRDRIAAFENKAAPSQNPAPAPPLPRPKPSGFAWKPRPPSPPSPPRSPENHGQSASDKHVGGMSASDAMESIGKAGSLKERMAALQGKGAFGAPPAPAPKPATERPQRKSPTVVLPPVEGQSNSEVPSPVRPPITPISLPDPCIDLIAREQPNVEEEEDNVVGDEQEEIERQRRAAIAARMARLGGTRVGMAPVFGKKPTVHEEAPLQEEETSDMRPHEDQSSSPAGDSVADQPCTGHTIVAPSVIQDSSENVSESGLHSPRVPTSMPVPTILRRAVPPRRKAPSSASESSPDAVDASDTADASDASDASDAIEESRRLDAEDSMSSAVTDDKALGEHNAPEPGDEVTSVVAETPEDVLGCIEQETPIVSAADEVTSTSGVASDSAVLAELAELTT